MSCSTCKKLREGVRLFYTTDQTTVISRRDGLPKRITQPLFPPLRTPRGGWSVTFTINGQVMVFPGSAGRNVYHSVERILTTNDIHIRPLDLWLNLNIAWLQRADKRHQDVWLEDILAISRLADDADDRIHLTLPPDSLTLPP